MATNVTRTDTARLEDFSDRDLYSVWTALGEQAAIDSEKFDYEWCEAVYSEIGRRGGVEELQRRVAPNVTFIDQHVNREKQPG